MDCLETELTQVDEGDLEASQGDCTAQLTVLTGEHLGRIIPLTRALHSLGRSRQADVELADASVSKLHAHIVRLADGAYQLVDLDSRNGTFVDGQRVVAPRRLQPGSRILLGARMLLQFSTVDQLDRQAHDAQHLALIGHLSAAVNEELADLLSVITSNLGHLSALESITNLGAEVVECIQDMHLAARRAGELTQRLNEFARRPDAPNLERVDLTALCDESLRLLARRLPADVDLIADVERGLWVDGSRAWLHRLLMKPCSDARAAMPHGGVLTFEARVARPEELAGHPGVQAGRHISVLISDTGDDTRAELLPRAVDPSFAKGHTREPSAPGLINLAAIANEIGASVRVSRRPGCGTSVRNSRAPRPRARCQLARA